MPCSGRTLPVPHFGPPMAPRRTASADLAASRAAFVRGSPVASIEACDVLDVGSNGGSVILRRRGDGLES